MSDTKTTTHSSIPATYWQTDEGKRLCTTLHCNGWEALDALNTISADLAKAIAAATDPGIKAELERARKKVQAGANAYRTATAILSDRIF